jgi:hypothetical protein
MAAMQYILSKLIPMACGNLGDNDGRKNSNYGMFAIVQKRHDNIVFQL